MLGVISAPSPAAVRALRDDGTSEEDAVAISAVTARLRESSSELPVLVLADHDDAGVSRLVASLATRREVTWWRFGLPESSVSVHVDESGFHLEQPEATVCSADFQRTPIVVYRRRFLQPRSLISSELPPGDRDFSEREWTSLVDGLLLAEERHGRSTWLNPPSATLLTNSKLSLLLYAARAGLPVPPFSISTPVRFPPTSRGNLVTKAISSDERIDATRYFSTALLSAEDLRDLPGARVPTPSLLQEYVPPNVELRVFYALGEFLTLELTPSDEHVDIRHSSRSKLLPRVHDLPQALRNTLGDLARTFNLGYCTFDLVTPGDGEPALLDITPNGDWDYFESDQAPVVTEFLADTIVSRQAGALRES